MEPVTQEKNNWKRRSTKLVYDNPWIELHHDEVITPTGSDGIYGRIHFKNKAIAIVPLDQDNNTWLVGQYRYTLGSYSWEIPMGGGPLQSDILESAKRELREETGITAKQWDNVMRLHTSNCVTDEEGFVFIARDLSYGDTQFDETEDLQIKKLPFSEVVDMVHSGRITDAITIAAVLKVDYLLRNNQ